MFIDQYFKSSNQDKSILWIIIFSGKNVLYDENVISIVPKTSNIYNKIKNFLSLVLNIFLKKEIYITSQRVIIQQTKLKNYLTKLKKNIFLLKIANFFSL